MNTSILFRMVWLFGYEFAAMRDLLMDDGIEGVLYSRQGRQTTHDKLVKRSNVQACGGFLSFMLM